MMVILGEKEIKYSDKLCRQQKLLRRTVCKSRNSMQSRMLNVIFEGFVGFVFFFIWQFIFYFCQKMFSFINLRFVLCNRLDEILIDLEELFNSLQGTVKTARKT